MSRILFVDDEPRVLNGLRRMLHPLRHQWQMEFAGNAGEALGALSRQQFDIVVTDIRMPGMDGAELLSEVARQFPEIVRIVLSGQPTREAAVKSAGFAHQFLSKPCDSETLTATINRAASLRDLLSNTGLQPLISRLGALPSVPSIYRQLTEALQDPEISIQEVGRVIEKDTAMTAKILQLVNSAFFGLRTRIGSVSDAALYLGIDTLKALAFSARIFSQFDTSRSPHFSIEEISRHGIVTAMAAQRVMKAENSADTAVQDAFLAGLLHDIGKLVLVSTVPEEYERAVNLAKERMLNPWEAEFEVFNTTHAEVGAYLLWLWGLPDAITDAVTYHHRPRDSRNRVLSPLTAVHVADSLQREQAETHLELDLDYLGELGLISRLPNWREVAALPAA